MGSYSGLN